MDPSPRPTSGRRPAPGFSWTVALLLALGLSACDWQRVAPLDTAAEDETSQSTTGSWTDTSTPPETSGGDTGDTGAAEDDVDGDGWGGELDCDDTDPSVHPGATEVCGDGRDNDCDGTGHGCSWRGEHHVLEAQVRILGREPGDLLGQGLAAVGDMDGDGHGDVAFGAWRHGAWGEAYLVISSGDLRLEGVWPTNAGDADYRFSFSSGADGKVALGSELVGVGDVDGDGLADLLLASGLDPGACLVLGPGHDVAAGGDCNAVFRGQPRDELVTEVGAAGDLDGDGLADMAIATSWSGGNAPSAYVVLGSERGEPELGAAWLRIEGEDPEDMLASNLEGVGDLDGDGLDDLIITGPSKPPGVWVFQGPAGGTGLAAADTLLRWTGFQRGCTVMVEGLGDVDSDGFADFALGCSSGGDLAGEVLLIHGPITHDADPRDEARVRIEGTLSGQRLGWHMDGGHDVNGDGHTNLLVADELPTIYLFGRLQDGVHTPDVAEASFPDQDPLDDLGYGLAVSPDIDGDGVGDFFLGGRRHADEAGAVFLFSGEWL